MTSEHKKTLMAGTSILLGSIVLFKYGNEPRVTKNEIQFNNVPMKFFGIVLIGGGLYFLLKKQK